MIQKHRAGSHQVIMISHAGKSTNTMYPILSKIGKPSPKRYKQCMNPLTKAFIEKQKEEEERMRKEKMFLEMRSQEMDDKMHAMQAAPMMDKVQSLNPKNSKKEDFEFFDEEELAELNKSKIRKLEHLALIEKEKIFMPAVGLYMPKYGAVDAKIKSTLFNPRNKLICEEKDQVEKKQKRVIRVAQFLKDRHESKQRKRMARLAREEEERRMNGGMPPTMPAMRTTTSKFRKSRRSSQILLKKNLPKKKNLGSVDASKSTTALGVKLDKSDYLSKGNEERPPLFIDTISNFYPDQSKKGDEGSGKVSGKSGKYHKKGVFSLPPFGYQANGMKNRSSEIAKTPKIKNLKSGGDRDRSQKSSSVTRLNKSLWSNNSARYLQQFKKAKNLSKSNMTLKMKKLTKNVSDLDYNPKYTQVHRRTTSFKIQDAKPKSTIFDLLTSKRKRFPENLEYFRQLKNGTGIGDCLKKVANFDKTLGRGNWVDAPKNDLLRRFCVEASPERKKYAISSGFEVKIKNKRNGYRRRRKSLVIPIDDIIQESQKFI